MLIKYQFNPKLYEILKVTGFNRGTISKDLRFSSGELDESFEGDFIFFF